MNLLEFILLVSVAIVVLAVAIDVSSQVWSEKRAERKEYWAKMREAEAILHASIAKHFEMRTQPPVSAIELNVTTLPKKSTGGRHRLTAA